MDLEVRIYAVIEQHTHTLAVRPWSTFSHTLQSSHSCCAAAAAATTGDDDGASSSACCATGAPPVVRAAAIEMIEGGAATLSVL